MKAHVASLDALCCKCTHCSKVLCKSNRSHDLAELAIVSAASVNAGPGPDGAFRLTDAPGVAVTVARAEGQRCARSWRVTKDVGQDPRYPDLSARDAAAVALWDAAHAR